MGAFIARRALHSLFALVGLVILVFFMARLTGSPADLYLPIDATLEQRQEFNQRHGFDQPVVAQFSNFLVGLTQGDLGHSIRKDRPALDVVLEAIPTTLWLAAVTMVLALGGAIIVGALAARHPGGAFDRIASTASLAGASAPDFWLAISAILLFAVTLGWLPTSGMGGPATWIMPVAVLVVRPFGILVQVVRNTMVGVLTAPYIKTARAKGIRERPILFVHALRNAMLPVITVAGDQAAGIVNGAVIVESIFGWPGIGKLMIDSIIQRDFAIIQASIFVTATLIFIMNILLDLAYAGLDPRVRTAT
jgi:peptide/nickel transport system permease protein